MSTDPTPTPGKFRSALQTIGRGFLLGVGLSIAFALAGFIAFEVGDALSHRSYGGYTTVVDAGGESPLKAVTIADAEEQRRGSVVAIVGSVKNTGTRPLRGVQLRANLFKQGKFVDQYVTSVQGTLEAGATQYFKISCGCGDNPPAEHDSFKVEVVNSY